MSTTSDSASRPRETRPDITWTFTVLDSQETNAFALPGGYVYITRGIMTYLNSEAELAAVLGHEIGHVTARHAVRAADRRHCRRCRGDPACGAHRQREPRQHRDAAGSALISGYGRDMELEADHSAPGTSTISATTPRP